MTDPASFDLRYVPQAEFDAHLAAEGASVLGVIGYGVGRPASLAPACPFAEAALPVLAGGPVFEVWHAPAAAEYRQHCGHPGAVAGALGFGIVALNERGRPLEPVIEEAYRDVFDCLGAFGGGVPIRFWNYLPAINGVADGMERYRRFNIGRHEVFRDRLTLPIPPAATAVGSRGGEGLIYFLAGPEAALPIENPRQVSAYDYPPVYGPRSPRFSRASILGRTRLFVSGTASIVGHESLHPGDPTVQITEALRNVEALVAEARRKGLPETGRRWSLKIYLREPWHLAVVRPLVEAEFPGAAILYLQADICRSELLVEIEAFCRD